MGEVSWSLTRGLIYAIGFLVVMTLLGLVLAPTALLAIPGALLVGLAAASVGDGRHHLDAASGRTST